MKTCYICKAQKPATLEYFGMDRNRPDGLYPGCKPCTKAQKREWTKRWEQPELPADHAKTCRQCKESKPAAEFRKKPGTRDGHDTICTPCFKTYSKAWRAVKAPRTEKRCPTCETVRPASAFMADSSSKDTLSWQCRDCSNGSRRIATAERIKDWLKPCLSCGTQIGGTYGVWTQKYCEPCRARIYAEKMRINHAAHAARLGPERVREIQRGHGTRRRKNPKYRLHDSMTSRVYRVLKGRKKGPLHDLVPYTHQELIDHLERQFEPGMSWENYGRGGWHVGHRRPVSRFKFESPQDPEFVACWALSNLFPQWEFENLSAGNRRSFELPELHQSPAQDGT